MVAFLGSYLPHPKQAAMHADGARFLAASAGTRGGKTAGMAREFVKRIYQDEQRHPGVDRVYWVVTPTVKIGQTAKRELLRLLQQAWAIEVAAQFKRSYRAARQPWRQSKGVRGLIANWNRGTSQLYLIGGRSQGHGDGPSNILVEFRTTTDPDGLVAEGCWGVWMDEAARCKAAAWKGGLRQRLSDHQGWALFSTTPMGRNWYWAEVHKRGLASSAEKDPQYSSHCWVTSDNTGLPGLAEEVEQARRELPTHYFRREYEASFDAFQGQIYRTWDARSHVGEVEEVAGYYDRIVAGLDFGWTHPGAFHVWGIREPRDGERRRRYSLLYERWEPGVPVVSSSGVVLAGNEAHHDCWAKTIVRQALRWAGSIERLMIHCDPARPDSIFALQQLGISAMPAQNAVSDGIECISKAMHPDGLDCPWFTVRPDARGFQQNAEAYVWKQTKDGEDGEKPVKENDDAADAARYAIYSDSMVNPMRAAAA